MWIKLISPAVTKRPMDSDWKTHMSPPLALLVLGALTPESYRVTVADENVEKLCCDDQPDLVGITVKADTFSAACRIATGYRSRGIPVVFGGIHPTVCPDICAIYADAVVVGQAESTWPQLLKDFEAGDMERVYRDSREVDPALTPPPKWDLLDTSRSSVLL